MRSSAASAVYKSQAKGKALVAKATVERDAAKLRREAAVRAHADSEQALSRIHI